MRCPNCDYFNAPSSNFCVVCGYQIDNELKLCPNCKGKTSKGWLFCVHCGMNLRQIKIVD